jgi:hypothetical protein
MNALRRMKRWTLLAVAAGALALGATPAGAAEKLGPVTSFGSLGQPNDMTVDQSTGNVFVADVATDSVYEFHRKSSTEYELVGTLTGSETPAGSFAFHENEPAAIAVDGTEGVLYVADLDHHVMDKFKLIGPGDYKYECVFTGWVAGMGSACNKTEEPATEAFGEVTGVAVDSHGYVFVSDFTHEVVDEFTPSGTTVETQIKSALTNEASNLAVDSLDDLYLSHFDGNVQKFKVDYLTGQIESEEAGFNSGPAFAVSVDPSTNDVYIALGSDVVEYESSGRRLSSFTEAGMDSEGVAIDEATHEIYVSDRGNGRVDVFGPVVVPDVTRCGESNLLATSATLDGTVNPLGTKEASYYFQYGEAPSYGLLAPEPPGTDVGEGSVFVPATENINGLAPGTIYHCRLDATNSSGLLEEGEDGSFETLPEPPRVEEASASAVTPGRVVLKGAVNRGHGLTSYHFLYGRSASYGLTLPSIGIGRSYAPCEGSAPEPCEKVAIGVEQAPEVPLEPGTTYHYRLIAENAGGVAESADETFATPAVAHPPTIPPMADTGPVTVVSQTEATIGADVYTGGLPATYEFEVGPTTAYGTQIFGQTNGEPLTIATTLSGLEPATTYHYRVTVHDASGTSYGADQAFTTPTYPSVITQPMTPLLVPVPPQPTAIKQHVVKKKKKKKKVVAHKTHRKSRKHPKATARKTARR